MIGPGIATISDRDGMKRIGPGARIADYARMVTVSVAWVDARR
jgi:hypothetical protein